MCLHRQPSLSIFLYLLFHSSFYRPVYVVNLLHRAERCRYRSNLKGKFRYVKSKAQRAVMFFFVCHNNVFFIVYNSISVFTVSNQIR